MDNNENIECYFVSCSNKNLQKATTIKKQLEELGGNVYLSCFDSSDYDDAETLKYIGESDVFIAIVSQETTKTDNQYIQTSFASNKKKAIFQIQIEKTALSPKLGILLSNEPVCCWEYESDEGLFYAICARIVLSGFGSVALKKAAEGSGKIITSYERKRRENAQKNKIIFRVVLLSLMAVVILIFGIIGIHKLSKSDATPAEYFIYRIEDEEVCIESYYGISSNVVIPSKIDGYPVRIICSDAFSFQEVKTIVIPGSVRVIESHALSNVQGLTSVTILDGVRFISERAFSNCLSLTTIIIPGSITEIGANAFCNCRALESVELSEGINSFGVGSFEGCESLKSITIPYSVRIISKEAFKDCTITVNAPYTPDYYGYSIDSGVTWNIC